MNIRPLKKQLNFNKEDPEFARNEKLVKNCSTVAGHFKSRSLIMSIS
jgi:hypothetical protein